MSLLAPSPAGDYVAEDDLLSLLMQGPAPDELLVESGSNHSVGSSPVCYSDIVESPDAYFAQQQFAVLSSQTVLPSYNAPAPMGSQPYAYSGQSSPEPQQFYAAPPAVATKKKRTAPRESMSDDDSDSAPQSASTDDYKRQRKRDQNRASAVRSRQRKKVHMESMQSQMQKLAADNDMLTRENSTLKAENRLLSQQLQFLQVLLRNNGAAGAACQAPSVDAVSALPVSTVSPPAGQNLGVGMTGMKPMLFGVFFCVCLMSNVLFPSSVAVSMDGARTPAGSGRMLLSVREADAARHQIMGSALSQLLSVSAYSLMLALAMCGLVGASYLALDRAASYIRGLRAAIPLTDAGAAHAQSPAKKAQAGAADILLRSPSQALKRIASSLFKER